MSEYSIFGPFCGKLDPLYGEAVQAVRSANRGSISTVQRVLRIGFNRAALMVEAMEKDGIVSAPNPVNGSRSVLKGSGPKPRDGGSDGG